MRNKLYRKRILPSGRTKYEQAFEFDDGDIREGLWLHRKEKGGRSYSWVSEYCGPTPGMPARFRNRAALETKRQDILNVVNGTSAMTNFDAVVSACFDVIAGVK